MLWDDTETRRLRSIIASSARSWTRAEVQWMLDVVARHRPAGYYEHQVGVRLRYDGHQRRFLDEALRRRFPQTHDAMPRVALNWLELIASQDAGVYQLAAERWLEDAAGVRIAAEDPRAIEWAATLADADIDARMPEAERRACAALTLFARVRWSQPPGKRGRAVVDLRWPHEVGVICHHCAPEDIDYATLVVAETTGPTGVQAQARWFEVFSRDWEEDAAGALVAFGSWRRHLVSSDGDALATATDDATIWDGPLPWAVVTVGIPQGSVYVDRDRDLVDVVDALNVSRSSEQHTLEVQGHTPLVYAGSQFEAASMRAGPDVVNRIGAGETLSTLSMDPKLEDMRESRKLATRELAITRRNAPGAYATEPGPPQSGVARVVEQIPHDTMLRERAHTWVAFEQRALLPLLVDAHDRYAEPERARIGVDVRTRMKPAAAPTYEDPEARQRRALEAKDARLISEARAAVEAGWYATTADAVAAGLVDEVRPAAPALPVSPFATSPPEAPKPGDDAKVDDPAKATPPSSTDPP